MILGKEALHEAEKNNLVRIINRQEFGAFSTDIRIDKLYRHTSESWKFLENRSGSKTDIESTELLNYLEPVAWNNNRIVLSRHNYLFWQPVEQVELAPFFVAEVYSRSGWARLGAHFTDDMETRTYSQERRKVSPLCLAYSYGPEIEIERGDSVAQMVIKDDGLPFLLPEHIRTLVAEKDFVIEKNGRNLRYEDLSFENSRPLLTMDEKILVYTGGVLRKNGVQKEHFKEVDISQPVLLPKGTFFISSSEQSIQVPESCAGYVSQFIFSLPIITHPNAPLIGPKNVFRGKVTFENEMTEDYYVQKGMPQAYIHLIPLRGASAAVHKSSYFNQDAAQLSKI